MKQSLQSDHAWSRDATLKLPAGRAKEPDVAGGIVATQHLERINLSHRNSELHKAVVRTAGWKCSFERRIALKNIRHPLKKIKVGLGSLAVFIGAGVKGSDTVVLRVPRISIPHSVSGKEGLCLLEPRSAAAQVRSISVVPSPFLPAPSGYSSSPPPPPPLLTPPSPLLTPPPPAVSLASRLQARRGYW